MFSLTITLKNKVRLDKRKRKILNKYNINNIEIEKLEKIIDKLLWELRFITYTKGVLYLKMALCLVYINESFLFDYKKLIKEISSFYKTHPKTLRNNIDNALNSAFTYENLQYDIDFFDGYYDGRRVNLKYFFSLAIYYINKNMK